MKQLPDRDWFTANGVCATLEVSPATLHRMLRSENFPPANGRQGSRLIWSFSAIADYCTCRLEEEQRRAFYLLDHIEKVREARRKREVGKARAIVVDKEIERLREKAEREAQVTRLRITVTDDVASRSLEYCHVNDVDLQDFPDVQADELFEITPENEMAFRINTLRYVRTLIG